MLTIFSCPKAFNNWRISMIQESAIKSWLLLRPRPEIILMGDEQGIADICKELGLRHMPEVERNEFGTPLVSSLFSRAQSEARNDVLCYVNADIILTSDFMLAVEAVAERFEQFLMVGRRWNVNLQERWDFGRVDWEKQLKEVMLRAGRNPGWCAVDYFVFRRGLYARVPPFAVGRGAWDNWLVYYARASKVPVIDASLIAQVAHQEHDYGHVPGGEAVIRAGPEAQRNQELAAGHQRFCIADSTYVLTKRGIRKAVGLIYLWRRFYTLATFYPVFGPVRWVIDVLLHLTRGIRVKFGLTLGEVELLRYPHDG